MLADMVEQGTLPELKKRLPAEPVVVTPNDRVGVYGGDWRLITLGSGAGAAAGLYSVCGYENLVRWDPTFKEIIPNVADSWEISEDGTTYTFRLHEGIRWSDGEPFTADDIVFATNDVLMNGDLYPVSPFGDVSAEKIDDYTVRLTFAVPNGLLLTNLATRRGSFFSENPSHYMKRFHQEYNADVNDLVEQENLEDWVALYHQKNGRWSFESNLEKPSIYPWLLRSSSQTQVVVERNPYYWKVDPDGRQLPYIDTMTWQVMSDPEAALLQLANGDVDFAYQDPPGLAFHLRLVDKPVLAESRDSGSYRFFDAVPARTSDICIYLNLTHKNAVLREIFNTKDFRIGLSHAIDRRTLIDAVFQGQGEPWQIAPRAESGFYDEEMAHQYLEYDTDRANQYLDRAYPDKDESGIRLGPDGKPITFQVEVRNDSPTWVDTMQLVVDGWKAVGVNAGVNVVSLELARERGEANDHDAAVWTGEGGLDAVLLLNPFNYLPTNPPFSFFGVPWCTWYLNGREGGEEPPPSVKEQLELYDQLNATPDPTEQQDLMRQILQICKDQFFGIGTVAPTESYGTISERTRNFPSDNVMSSGALWVHVDPAPTNPSQYFIEERQD